MRNRTFRSRVAANEHPPEPWSPNGAEVKAKINEKVYDILRQEENRQSISDVLSSAVSTGSSESVEVKDQDGKTVTLRVRRAAVPSQ